jgi:hypothetical protein
MIRKQTVTMKQNKMNRDARKGLKILLIGAAVVLLVGVAWFWYGSARGIRVGTAVVSKTLCSGVFVSGLDPDLLYAEAIKPIPGQDQLAKRLKYNVDRGAMQVTATWLGGFESRAIYRDGFGCTLVHGDLPGDLLPGAPMHAGADAAAPLEVEPRSPKLEAALDRAFAEPAQPPYRWVKAIVILHDGKLVAERYARVTGWIRPSSATRSPNLLRARLLGAWCVRKSFRWSGGRPLLNGRTLRIPGAP